MFYLQSLKILVLISHNIEPSLQHLVRGVVRRQLCKVESTEGSNKLTDPVITMSSHIAPTPQSYTNL